MKVLFINPPTSRGQSVNYDKYFPLGILSLATVLKHNSIDAEIIDINNHYHMKEFNEDNLRNYVKNNLFPYIRDYKPNIIGIGCVFSGAFKNLKLTAYEIKRKFPKIPIVIGGIHPTIFAGDIIRRYNYIDYVIIGEGESSFLQLIRFLTNAGQSLKAIDGIAFRSKDDIKINPKTKFIHDLDELPFIDFGMLDIKKYYIDTSNWYSPKKIKLSQPFPIISSRSCPNRCTFCSMWLVHGPRFRHRSANNVLDEMEYLYKKYNINYFRFMDDNLTYDKKRILEICKGILKRNMNIHFDTPNGVAVSRLDGEIIDVLVAAGARAITLAIESGSEYIRNKIMRKNLPTEKIYEVIEACAKHPNLSLKSFWIIGMPQETHETLQETYEMIKKLPLNKFDIFFATPYPGTELFDFCIKHDLLLHKADDYIDVKDLHYVSSSPHLKPFKLTIKDLLTFREKLENLLKEKSNI